MKAYEIISSDEKWTQHAFAYDCNGAWVQVDSPDASCFCAIGAILKAHSKSEDFLYASPEKGGPRADVEKLRKHIEDTTRYVTVTAWNDSPNRNWKEVHDVLKELDL